MNYGFEAMKGPSRRLLTLVRGGVHVELVQYIDESFGIMLAGQSVGVWEPDEEEQCIQTFAKIGRIDEKLPPILLQSDASSRVAFKTIEAARNEPSHINASPLGWSRNLN